MTDLFDLLPVDESVRHMLMPNMGLACGRDILLTPERWVMAEDATTCADCIAAAEPHGGLHAWCEAMQGRQAPIKG